MMKFDGGAEREEEASYASALREVREIVQHVMPRDGTRNLFGPVWASRASTATAPTYAVYDPVFCLVAQGSKRVQFGDECAVYDTRHYLLNTIALPVSSIAVDATQGKPFLSLSLVLDPATVQSVIVDAGLRPPERGRPLRAMASSRIDLPLLDAVLRLARLAKSPGDAAFLGPLAVREVVYRLLIGAQGARLYASASLGGQARPASVSKATAPSGSAPPDACRRSRRRRGGLSRRLRGCRLLQPRLQAFLRRAPASRHASIARKRADVKKPPPGV